MEAEKVKVIAPMHYANQTIVSKHGPIVIGPDGTGWAPAAERENLRTAQGVRLHPDEMARVVEDESEEESAEAGGLEHVNNTDLSHDDETPVVADAPVAAKKKKKKKKKVA